MRIEETPIPGCVQIFPRKLEDCRGAFIKTFRDSVYREHGLGLELAEEYYSVSTAGVLRGMHFQLPPHDHAKLVYCVSGEVLDVVLDLRIGSPMLNACQSFTLDDKSCSMLFIPPGCAHGFYTLSDRAILIYKTTTEYAPEHDSGVLWKSIPFTWPNAQPLLSERDRELVSLEQFDSPFSFPR